MPEIQAVATPAPTANAVRDSLVSEMPFREDAPAKVDAKPAKAAPVDDVETPTAADIDADEVEAQAADEVDEAEVEEASPDKDTQKRLDVIARAEKRAKQQLAADRLDFEEQRQAWKSEQRAAQAAIAKFEEMKTRAKRDPAGFMRSVGLAEDDFELAAQALYAESKAGMADPKRRAAVDAALRQRETGDSIAELRAQVEALKTEKLQAAARAEQATIVDQFVTTVAKAATAEKAPLVAKYLAKSPAKARAGLAAAALALLEAEGDVPEHADVIAAYELQRRRELEEMDVDLDVYLGRTDTAATITKKPSKTIGSKLGSSTPPAKVKRMSDDDIRRAIETDSLE
jgi:hypothetical protein